MRIDIAMLLEYFTSNGYFFEIEKTEIEPSKTIKKGKRKEIFCVFYTELPLQKQHAKGKSR